MARVDVRKVSKIARRELDILPLTIGRSSENVIVLPHTFVSRHHCIIDVVEGRTMIRDLSSRCGTRVNGQKITEATLKHGDRVRVGPFELVFEDAKNAGETTNGSPHDSAAGANDSAIPLSDESAAGMDSQSATAMKVPDGRSTGPRREDLETIAALKAELDSVREECQHLRDAAAAAGLLIDASASPSDEPHDSIARADAAEAEVSRLKAQVTELQSAASRKGADAIELAALRRKLDDLQSSHDGLEAEIATTQAERSAAEAERAAVAEKLQAADSALLEARNQTILAQQTLNIRQAETDRLRELVADLEPRLQQAEDAQRVAVEETRLAVEQAAQHQAAEMQTRLDGFQQRLGDAEAALTTEQEAARRSSQSAAEEIHRLHLAVTSLQQQLDELETARRLAADRAEHATRAINTLSGQIHPLADLARQVSSLQERLAEAETAWVEADQLIDEMDPDDPTQIEAARRHRLEISAQLDALNAQRDEAVTRLRETAHRLRVIAEKEAPKPPLSVAPEKADPPSRGLFKLFRSKASSV